MKKQMLSILFLAGFVASVLGQTATLNITKTNNSLSLDLLKSSTTGEAGYWLTPNVATLITSPSPQYSLVQTNTKNRQYIQYNLNKLASKASLEFDFRLGNFRGVSYGYYDFAAMESPGGEYIVLAFKDFPGKDFAFRVHTQAGVGKDIPVKANTTYNIKMLWDQTERLSTLKVYEGGALLGTSTLILRNEQCRNFCIGRYDAHASTSPELTYYDNITIDITGKSFYDSVSEASPVPPIIVPSPIIVPPFVVLTNPPVPFPTIVTNGYVYTTNQVVSSNSVVKTNVLVTFSTNIVYSTNFVITTNIIVAFFTNANTGPVIFPPEPTNLPPVIILPPGTNDFYLPIRTGTIIEAKSAERADILAAYNLAKSGDTIKFTGEATWTTSFSITKRVSLIGSGTNSAIITFNLPSQTSSGFIVTANGTRISGIQIKGIKGANKGRAIEVRADKCVFSNLFIDQMYWGFYLQDGFNLVHSVHFRDCQKYIRFHGKGAGTYNWDTYNPIPFDSLNYAVAEDCVFENTSSMPNVGALNAISSQQGASWVVRNSLFKVAKDPYGPILDAHGNIDPGLRGVVCVQVINNRFEVTSPGEFYKLFDWRGGSGIFASNTIVAPSGEMVVLREEDPEGGSLTPPYRDPHSRIYIWANKIGARITPIRVEANDSAIIRNGVEYFENAPENFKSLPYPHPLRNVN